MTGLMLLVMSGCGMKEIQNNKAQKLSAEEKAILDLTENGSAKTRSINEICVQEEPLVMRENVYNESGVLVQYFQYEYDQFNRYKTVYNYQKDSDTEEFILFSQDDYSYIRVDGLHIPNTSLSLTTIAKKIAELRNTTVAHILRISYENAERIYAR